MKIRLSEATKLQLNWLVAWCEGKVDDITWYPDSRTVWYGRVTSGFVQFNPTTNWAQGGPIIERERIQLRIDEQGNNCAVKWIEGIGYGPRVEGPTPLIAAMRAFVASKLGDEVEVPDEL